MENISYETLSVLLFLIPGLMALSIKGMLVSSRRGSFFESTVESLIYSMIIYSGYVFIFGVSPISLEITVSESSTAYKMFFDKWSFFTLTAMSLAFSVILSVLVTHDLHMRLARWLRITNRTSRATVWADVFTDKKTHVIINFKNGRRIMGWPMYYSDDPGEPYIFLSNPSWVDTKNNKFIHLRIPGILITPEQKIESIEFLPKGGAHDQ